MAMVRSGGSGPGVIAQKRMVAGHRMRVAPDHKCRSTIRNVFYATVERAVLDLAAHRHEAVMKLSGRFFLGG